MYAKNIAQLGNGAGDLNVLMAGRWISAGMIVEQNNIYRVMTQRLQENISGGDQGGVNTTFGQKDIADLSVFWC